MPPRSQSSSWPSGSISIGPPERRSRCRTTSCTPSGLRCTTIRIFAASSISYAPNWTASAPRMRTYVATSSIGLSLSNSPSSKPPTPTRPDLLKEPATDLSCLNRALDFAGLPIKHPNIISPYSRPSLPWPSWPVSALWYSSSMSVSRPMDLNTHSSISLTGPPPTSMEMAETRTITTRYLSIPGSRFDRRRNYALPARCDHVSSENLRVSTASRVAVERTITETSRRCVWRAFSYFGGPWRGVWFAWFCFGQTHIVVYYKIK